MNEAGIALSEYCEGLRVQAVQSIQACGIFLAINIQNQRVKYISANLAQQLNLEPENIIGSALTKVFSSPSILALTKYLSSMHSMHPQSRAILTLEFLDPQKTTQRTCVLYAADNLLCIESDLNSSQREEEITEADLENMLQNIIHFPGSVEALATLVCQQVKEISCYDRVYYCEFEEDGHGYVLASETNSQLDSLTHHHFPASDLPMVVRKLYTKNRYRMIPNAEYEAVPILGTHGNLELSQSLYRAISPTHLEYLKNMGVQASASFSVVEGSILRGLVGCHSLTPRAIPLKFLPRIQQLVEAFAAKLLSYKVAQLQIDHSKIELNLVNFVRSYDDSHCNISRLAQEALKSVKDAFQAQSILCSSEEGFQSEPAIPKDFADLLVSFAKDKFIDKDIIASDCLLELSPEFEKWKNIAAGVLLISLDRNQSSFIALFRQEILQVRKWSGDPAAIQKRELNKLSPRNSFQTWVNQVNYKCKQWTPDNISLAKELRLQLLSIRSNYLDKLEKNNILLNKKNRANEILLSEVHHRVKNNLAIISALFDWKIKESTSDESILVFKEMKSRIRAISSLHQTLYQGNNFGFVNFASYIRSLTREVSLLLTDKKVNLEFKIDIPIDIAIPIADALPLGLISHEFITNSIKYAFQENMDGVITVEWKTNPEGTIYILKDNGIGCMDIEKLKGSSIGLQLIKLLINQIDASSQWNGSNGVSLAIHMERRFL